RDWMGLTREQRRDSVIENFTTYFGPAARQARGYLEQLWPAARWSRGGYGTVFPAGVLTSLGPALADPVGRVLWAGADINVMFNGHMDGAVRAGEATAAHALAD